MKTLLLWCSAHTPTQEQMTSLQEMGELLFLKDVDASLQQGINNCSSDRGELMSLASDINKLRLSLDCTIVQLGGSPMFLYIAGAMMNGCMSKQVIMFAHSERVSIDVPQEDGTVVKTSVFKHIGWI
jgi:hypothetical protein